MKRVHVHIAGLVQGVWFRESTRQEAERLGVAGWVRNLVDGRVEGVFEGAASQVDDLVAWCREGPSAARVDGIEIQEESPEGLTGFRVLR